MDFNDIDDMESVDSVDSESVREAGESLLDSIADEMNEECGGCDLNEDEPEELELPDLDFTDAAPEALNKPVEELNKDDLADATSGTTASDPADGGSKEQVEHRRNRNQSPEINPSLVEASENLKNALSMINQRTGRFDSAEALEVAIKNVVQALHLAPSLVKEQGNPGVLSPLQRLAKVEGVATDPHFLAALQEARSSVEQLINPTPPQRGSKVSPQEQGPTSFSRIEDSTNQQTDRMLRGFRPAKPTDRR